MPSILATLNFVLFLHNSSSSTSVISLRLILSLPSKLFSKVAFSVLPSLNTVFKTQLPSLICFFLCFSFVLFFSPWDFLTHDIIHLVMCIYFCGS